MPRQWLSQLRCVVFEGPPSVQISRALSEQLLGNSTQFSWILSLAFDFRRRHHRISVDLLGSHGTYVPQVQACANSISKQGFESESSNVDGVDPTAPTDGANVGTLSVDVHRRLDPHAASHVTKACSCRPGGGRASRTLLHSRSQGSDFNSALSERPRRSIAIRWQPQNMVATVRATQPDLTPLQS